MLVRFSRPAAAALRHTARAAAVSAVRAPATVVVRTPLLLAAARSLSTAPHAAPTSEPIVDPSPQAKPESTRVNSLVLTAAGPDRAGIVHDVSRVLLSSGANVEESRMTILGNDFAILLRVTVPAELDAAKLKSTLQAEFGEFVFSVRITTTHPSFEAPVRIFSVAVEGPDQPGIVQVLTRLFLEHKGSVRDLDTDTSNAPFAGYKIFSLKTVLALPINADFEAFEAALHKFEDEYGFDVDVNEGMNDDVDVDEDAEGEEAEEEEDDDEGPQRRGAPQQAARRQAAPQQPPARPGQQPMRGPPTAAPARGPQGAPGRPQQPIPAPRGPAPGSPTGARGPAGTPAAGARGPARRS